MTSATLSVAGSFGFLRDLLGVPDEGRELLLHSPFDYERQAVAYIPTRFPAPSDSAFCARMAEQATEIINLTRGRALFLFTSYRNMHEISRCSKAASPSRCSCRAEGQTRSSRIHRGVDSVLLATSSFWQGIDVPGESLSCLLIDKLPLKSDDP